MSFSFLIFRSWRYDEKVGSWFMTLFCTPDLPEVRAASINSSHLKTTFHFNNQLVLVLTAFMTTEVLVFTEMVTLPFAGIYLSRICGEDRVLIVYRLYLRVNKRLPWNTATGCWCTNTAYCSTLSVHQKAIRNDPPVDTEILTLFDRFNPFQFLPLRSSCANWCHDKVECKSRVVLSAN